jgi:hypothetical protein
MYLAQWDIGRKNNDATTESHDKACIKIYVTPDKITLQTSNNRTMFRYCMYAVREGIALTFTSSDDLDGVLELLFFTDSDHVLGNADGTSNSGMVAFLNGNHFHGCSCGQRCLAMNTAESEYIAVVKCLQFAIWTVLLLRELNFRVSYPIPILADNVAAILIAKSPTHTKYARHIELRAHYIRSVLPFRDSILAYVKSMWNFADLNTKAVWLDTA